MTQLAAPFASSVEPEAVTRILRLAGVPARFERARFGSFELRAGTRTALEAAQDVASEQTSLLLSGPPGTGKTHLSVSILAAIIAAHLDSWPQAVRMVSEDSESRAIVRPRLIVRFVVIPSFLDRIRASVRYAEQVDPLRELLEADLIVLDDLGRERPTDWVAERLYVLINERYNRQLPTVVTTNSTPEQLVRRGYDALVSRLAEDASFVRLEATDYRRRWR